MRSPSLRSPHHATPTIAARRPWVAEHEALTLGALRALAEAIAFAHQQPERTRAIIGKYTQSDDARLLERTYAALVPAWERNLAVPPEVLRSDLASLAEEIPAAREARPEQFIDNRYAAELERSGFLDQLYR